MMLLFDWGVYANLICHGSHANCVNTLCHVIATTSLVKKVLCLWEMRLSPMSLFGKVRIFHQKFFQDLTHFALHKGL